METSPTVVGEAVRPSEGDLTPFLLGRLSHIIQHCQLGLGNRYYYVQKWDTHGTMGTLCELSPRSPFPELRE